MNAFYCGLDVHKETTYATLPDNDRQVVTQKQMRNEEIPDFLKPYTIEKVAMEVSTYIVPMYRKLTGQGYDVKVSHPKKIRNIAEARIKSDHADSKALAELLRLDSLPSSYILTRELAELREKIRRRAFIVRQKTKLKVKIRDVLSYEA
jgi:transposase